MNYLKGPKFKKDLLILFTIIPLFSVLTSLLLILFSSPTNEISISSFYTMFLFVFLFAGSFYFYYNLPLLSNSKEAEEEVKVKAIIIFTIIIICSILLFLVLKFLK